VRQPFNTLLPVLKVACEIIKPLIKIPMQVILTTILPLLHFLTAHSPAPSQTISKPPAEISKAILEMPKNISSILADYLKQ
ncbi:hypothetical protein, partial [Staphylococcus capitis]|uniref:hypothetical protein n=1 Tax=Staphylococcus capitis TaxID=29388 RepID=UPI001C930FAF